MTGNGVGFVVVDNAAPEQVTDVRGAAVDLAFVAVEGKGETGSVGHPEVAVEPSLEVDGVAFEPVGELAVVPDVASQTRASTFRVVHVPLDLTRGAWQLRVGPVREENRVPRILPTHVLETGVGVPALVLDVSVAVAIAVIVDPSQCGPGIRLELSHQIDITRPALDLVKKDEVQRRRI